MSKTFAQFWGRKSVKKRLFPHKEGGRFYTFKGEKPESLMLATIPAFIQSLFNRQERMACRVKEWVARNKPLHTSIEPVITWIGHATFLIQLGGLNILTDPIFGSPSFLYPRVLPPGIEMQELPPIDVVLLSHNHPDHMDSTTLLELKKRNPNMTVLVPKGDKAWFDARRFDSVKECMWWDQEIIRRDGVSIDAIFLPSCHWSRRGIFDLNKSLWGSWMIRSHNYVIYFAGDTAYYKHFREIGNEFPNINAALMPIGPCEPENHMLHLHINAEQAGEGFLELGAQHFIPMHWGTFAFGKDFFSMPVERMKSWWRKNDHLIGPKLLHIVKAGQALAMRTFEEIGLPRSVPAQIQR